jgi:gluconate 2-dehydrogenase alpha chain
MKRMQPVDVVIVGGGWTGLTMARELTTRANLSVVVLERGPARRFADYGASMDEVDYAIRKKLMQNIAEETITHRHSLRDRAAPVRQYGHILPGTGVGGSGEHWTGYAERHTPDDFKLATRMREKWGTSRLPENLSVQDYPLTYDELEPYYWRVEQMMGIGGKAGNLRGKIIPGGNPFEGPRSFEFPNPPHKKTYPMALFEQATTELGYHPYPAPAATLTETYKNPDGITRGGCQYCGYCMLYGCMVAAKAQPTNTLLPVLSRQKNFILRPNSWVRRIVHRDGQAEGVVYMDEKGEETTQPARVVVVSSFTTNNARLLLLSKIGSAYDPKTGKGSLGRNFTHTVGGGGAALIFSKPLNGFMYAGGQAMRISDFDGFNGIPEDSGVLRGGISNTGGGGVRPIGSFGRMPRGVTARNWGSDWKKAAVEHFDKVASLGTFEMDHLAYKHNYVDLDPEYTDKWGDPLLRVTVDWTEHEAKQRAFASSVAARIAERAAKISGGMLISSDRGGMRGSRRYQTSDYATTHVQGGAIMGDAAENSVVNTWLQHWQIPNLWVVGASSFPQNSSSHPTVTAVALTLRAADGLIDKFLKKQGPLA